VLHRLDADMTVPGRLDEPAAAANRILAEHEQPAGRRRNRPVSWPGASAQRGRAAGITFVDRINAQLERAHLLAERFGCGRTCERAA
jgi:hypothetical protein